MYYLDSTILSVGRCHGILGNGSLDNYGALPPIIFEHSKNPIIN